MLLWLATWYEVFLQMLHGVDDTGWTLFVRARDAEDTSDCSCKPDVKKVMGGWTVKHKSRDWKCKYWRNMEQ